MTRFTRYFVCGAIAVGAAIAACGGSNSSPYQGQGSFEAGAPTDDGGATGFDASEDVASLLGNVDSSPSCVALQCQQKACAGGGTTTVSGTVYAPNGTLPLYNVILYVPNAPLAPMTQGITCDQCGTIASGDPIATTLSDSNGNFVLSNVPAGTNIPLVVQLGKWRRQTTIPTVNPCTNNALTDPNLTRLPKNQTEGSMPHIALTTGGCDSLGCMMGKLGIDTTEFGVQSDGYNKAINVYSSNSGGFADGLSNTTQASTLWSNLTLLKTYDMGIFSCECSEGSDTKGTYGGPDFQTVTDYLDSGGRIFTTDYQYTWYRYSPDPNMGAVSASNLDTTGIGVIPGGAPGGDNPLLLNATFPKGLALAQWLTTVFPANPLVTPDGGPLTNNTTDGVTCDYVFDNISMINTKPQLWATSDSSNDGKPGTYDPRVFTVNTPAGLPTAQQCGKGVHLDAHITASSQGEADFVGCNGSSGAVGTAGCYPLTCTNPLQEDEAMFAFFFFDLASCIQNEGQPPAPPPAK
ncbi:MAG: hypothetical protein ACLQVI_36505 [Polyangiaceae bacterium]